MRPQAAITVGVLTPHGAPGPELEFPEMAPGVVQTRVVHLHRGEPPTTPEGLRALTGAATLDRALERLPADEVDVVAHASTTTGYAIGYDAETAMTEQLATRSGRPVVSTTLAAVQALRESGVRRLALVHPPWFPDTMHRLGSAYFTDQGFEVVSVEAADLPNDTAAIESGAVVDWVLRNRPEGTADALWFGGNGFRAAGAVQALEDRLGMLVLESNQTLLWAIKKVCGTGFTVAGHGRLFER